MLLELVYLQDIIKLMKLYLALLLSFVLVACGNNSEEATAVVAPQKINNSRFGNTDFKIPQLSENAKTEVMHWGAFEDFEILAKSMNGETIESIKEKTFQLNNIIDSLSKKIPDTLYTNSIQTRVVVVKTRTKLLNQEVNKSFIDSITLQDYLKEFNISVTNLITQINEKFQKDAIDLQRIDNEKQELENQKRFLDSVYKAELQDKKKNKK